MAQNNWLGQPLKIPGLMPLQTSAPKKSCPKTIRDQLRVKWWRGEYTGTCFCCGRKISYEHVECGRIKAGGKYSVPNTRLICKTCNRGMGKQNLKIYMRRNFPDRYKKYFPKDNGGSHKPPRKPPRRYDSLGLTSFKLPKTSFGI